jgi:WD40 repeat protein
MRRAWFVVFGIVVSAAAISPLVAQRAAPPAAWPGYKGDDVTLLPNGWRIAPEGRHVTVGDLPMNLVPSPDGRFIAISTSGYAKPALSIFDTHTLQVVNRLEVDHTWLGLVWHPDGTRLFASGSSENVIYEFTFQAGRLKAAGNIKLGAPESHPGGEVIANAGFVAGMALSADGHRS